MASDISKLLITIFMKVLRMFWVLFGFFLTVILFVRKTFDRTRCNQWSKPVRVDSNDYPETNSLQLAFDGQGNAMAISDQDEAIFVKHFKAGEGWGEAVCIDQVDQTKNDLRGSRSAPGISLDSQGNAHAVWQENANYEFESAFSATTWVNRYSVDTGWGIAEPFNGVEQKDLVNIVGDKQGNLVAVWYRNTKGRSVIMAKCYSPLTGWGEEKHIAEHKLITHTLNIVANQRGHYIVTWDAREDQSESEDYFYEGLVPVYAIYYSFEKGWSRTTQVGDDFEHDKMDFQSAFDKDGNVILVWAHFVVATPNRVNIRAVRYDVQTGWGKSIEIDPGVQTSSGIESESEFPQIAFDSYGNAVVVWKQVSDKKYGGIWTNRYQLNKGWQDAGPVSNKNSWQTEARLAVASTGTACVVWAQTGGIAASFYNMQTGWSPPELIHKDNRDYGEYAPKIAVDDQDRFVVLWVHELKYFSSFWSIVYTEKEGWAKAVLVMRDFASSDTPELELDACGRAHVIWDERDSDSSNTHYWSTYK